MNTTNKVLEYTQKKQSGLLWVAIGLALLVLVVPIIIYGIVRATSNGIKWVGERHDRKLVKLQRKESKLTTKNNITELEQKTKELKEKPKGE